MLMNFAAPTLPNEAVGPLENVSDYPHSLTD